MMEIQIKFKEGKFNECVGLPNHTPDQLEALGCILDQNLEADREDEATGLEESLRAEVEALKEQRRHMQQQMPKPKKKSKKVVVNGRKQRSK